MGQGLLKKDILVVLVEIMGLIVNKTYIFIEASPNFI